MMKPKRWACLIAVAVVALSSCSTRVTIVEEDGVCYREKDEVWFGVRIHNNRYETEFDKCNGGTP